MNIIFKEGYSRHNRKASHERHDSHNSHDRHDRHGEAWALLGKIYPLVPLLGQSNLVRLSL